MPKDLSADPSEFPVQTSPVAGEPRTADSVEAALQRSANRTAFLRQRLDGVDPTGEGARRLRSVASLTALQALTDYADGTITQVRGVGLYQFAGTSIDAELSPLVIKPSAIASGSPGRWLVVGVGAGMLDTANGIPRLDANAKVPGARLAIANSEGRIDGSNIAYGTLQVIALRGLTPVNVPADGSYVTIAEITLTFPLAVGDLVLLDYDIAVAIPVNASAQFRLLGSGPAGANFLGPQLNTHTSTIARLGGRVQLARHHTAAAGQAGTYTVLAQAAASGDPATVGESFARAMIIRP